MHTHHAAETESEAIWSSLLAGLVGERKILRQELGGARVGPSGSDAVEDRVK